jgi:hypothetical protein
MQARRPEVLEEEMRKQLVEEPFKRGLLVPLLSAAVPHGLQHCPPHDILIDIPRLVLHQINSCKQKNRELAHVNYVRLIQ